MAVLMNFFSTFRNTSLRQTPAATITSLEHTSQPSPSPTALPEIDYETTPLPRQSLIPRFIVWGGRAPFLPSSISVPRIHLQSVLKRPNQEATPQNRLAAPGPPHLLHVPTFACTWPLGTLPCTVWPVAPAFQVTPIIL